MSGHGPFNHRGYVLTIQSHEVRKGGWVATVTIEQVAEGKPQPIRLHGIGFILLRPEMRRLQVPSNRLSNGSIRDSPQPLIEGIGKR